MSPRPDVREARRLQIIESAIAVFAREGFARTRMDDVAREAGLSKGLLYWYFKSKDAIIAAIADTLFGGELRKIEAVSCQALSAGDCLTKLLETFVADLRLILKLRPVIFEFYALAFRNETVRASLKKYLHTFVHILEPVIQKGMADGEFASADARQAALAFGAMVEGVFLLWAYDPDMVSVEDLLRRGSKLLLKGLQGNPDVASV